MLHCSLLLTFCLRLLTKRPAILQQLYKTASRGLSAIAELLVILCLQNMASFLGERYWVTFASRRRKSVYLFVVCLSETLVHPT